MGAPAFIVERCMAANSRVAKTDYGLINQSTNHSTRSRRTCGCLRGILPRVLGAILLPGEVVHDSRGRLYTPGQLTRYPQEAKAHMVGASYYTRQSLDVAGSERPSIFVYCGEEGVSNILLCRSRLSLRNNIDSD